MNAGFFITATDTDVGKTFVSYLIARGLQRAGVNFSYIKPVATGGKMVRGELVSPDVIFLKKYLRLRARHDELNPVCLRAPLAPYPAARMEKKKIDTKKILDAVRAAARQHRVAIIEGIGGVAVPITRRRVMLPLETFG
ncbi:MAG TPA: dethiobiotin synthase, partial [bacterium]|nr:dethiobiotin synthase [bacterium]